jgi:hypothetical protein
VKSLPRFLKKYFWNVDFLKLDRKTHSQFIIERILEYGDEKTVKRQRASLWKTTLDTFF